MSKYVHGLRWKALVLPSLLALGSSVAQAADNGFYLGVGATQAKVDDVFDTNLELDNTSYKIIAGFRPLDLLAVEANYIDLGDDSQTALGATGTVDAKAFAGFGMLFLPIPIVDVYAKLGLARWEVDGRINAGSTSLFQTDDSGTELAYGAGAQLQFGSLGARLEYESFDIDNTDGAELISLGITYTFL